MAYDLGVTMPWEALYRLQFLESRYLSFKALVKEDGVRWDEPNNIGVATDDTWMTILKVMSTINSSPSISCFHMEVLIFFIGV